MYKVIEVERGYPLPGKGGKIEEWHYRGDLTAYYEDYCTEDGEWYGREKDFTRHFGYVNQGFTPSPDGEVRLDYKCVVLVATTEPEVNEFGEVCP